MKNRTFLVLFTFLMGIATFASAQNRGGHNGNGQNRGRGQAQYNQNPNRNGGNCDNNGYYNGGNCNNNNGYRRDRCDNRYGNRRVYRRPVNYCQQMPVVVYQQPQYFVPAPRVIIGRPRVNINIGF